MCDNQRLLVLGWFKDRALVGQFGRRRLEPDAFPPAPALSKVSATEPQYTQEDRIMAVGSDYEFDAAERPRVLL
jgi:hypothetical protein